MVFWCHLAPKVKLAGATQPSLEEETMSHQLVGEVTAHQGDDG